MNLLPESKRCTRDGCEEPRHARQLCNTHYMQHLKEHGADEPVPDGSWRDDAACLGLDPDLFFPTDTSPERADLARAVCADCTVTEECLDYAIATNQRWGIWGGTSDRDRRRIRQQRRQVSA